MGIFTTDGDRMNTDGNDWRLERAITEAIRDAGDLEGKIRRDHRWTRIRRMDTDLHGRGGCSRSVRNAGGTWVLSGIGIGVRRGRLPKCKKVTHRKVTKKFIKIIAIGPKHIDFEMGVFRVQKNT